MSLYENQLHMEIASVRKGAAKVCAELRAENAALLAELELHAHSLSPAMVQARNDQLNAENAALRDENERRRDATNRIREEMEHQAERANFWESACDKLHEVAADNAALREDAADMQATFDLMFEANQRGIALWQAAHPDKAHVWPDHARLTEWLLTKITALRAKVEECTRLLSVLRPRTLVVYRDKRNGNGLADTSLTREIDAALAKEESP